MKEYIQLITFSQANILLIDRTHYIEIVYISSQVMVTLLNFQSISVKKKFSSKNLSNNRFEREFTG